MLRSHSRFSVAARAALGLLVGVAACDEGKLLRPAGSIPVDPMFTRYVSVGNSITAGFQSGGINEATQSQSYAVLLAGRMRTPFYIPAMAFPGCPSLYTNVFTQTRVAPTVPCALRKTDPVPAPYINNVAVPGAEVMDAVSNLDPASNANALTTFFLGGLTQLEMLERVGPTFVTVWIGNNDALGAATSFTNAGDSTLITPAATFAQRYDAMMTAIDAANPAGGVLVGVAKVTAIPFFSLGSTYWAIDNGQVPGQAFPPTFVVDNNCAPDVTMIPGARGDQTLVPFPYGGALLAAAAAGAPAALSCADTVRQVVVPSELVALATAVATYNQTVSAAATARGWAYFDPNPTLDSLRAIFTEVAPFPAFADAMGNPTPCSTNPFGLSFSCDAVHPAAKTHKLIANKLLQQINATYGTSLTPVP
ncbi:MAG: SGNH/GDSL hydrolase family protein [Gemmatimonadales bacterium]